MIDDEYTPFVDRVAAVVADFEKEGHLIYGALKRPYLEHLGQKHNFGHQSMEGIWARWRNRQGTGLGMFDPLPGQVA